MLASVSIKISLSYSQIYVGFICVERDDQMLDRNKIWVANTLQNGRRTKNIFMMKTLFSMMIIMKGPFIAFLKCALNLKINSLFLSFLIY